MLLKQVLSYSNKNFIRISRLLSNNNNNLSDEELVDRLFKVKPAITKEEDDRITSDVYDPDDIDDLLEEYDETDPTHRIGKYILQLGRNRYKQIIHPSEWFKSKQAEICNYRTPAQIRRHLKQWMVEYDREYQAKFLHKPLILRHDDTDSKQSNKLIAYGPDDTIAYAHYLMPSRYIILMKLLNDLKIYLPNYKPLKVIDFGCGPGTAGAAIKEIYSENFLKYTGIDISRSMLDSARILLENSQIDCVFYDNINNIIKQFKGDKDRYNLAVLSYTLSELTTDASRRAAIQILYELLDEGGCMIIIEGGNPRGSHLVRSARQFALDNFNQSTNRISKKHKNNSKDNYTDPGISYILPPIDNKTHQDIGIRVIAPCTHDKPCPLNNGQYCSFAQSVVSGMIKKASQEKYSYVILQKMSKVIDNKLANDAWTSDDVSIDKLISEVEYLDNPNIIYENINNYMTTRQILIRFLACVDGEDAHKLTEKLSDEIDWEEYSPKLYRKEWSRVIRSPIKVKGHMTLDVCTPNGFIARSVFSNGNTIDVPSLRKILRKTSWGGLFPSDIIVDYNESISPLNRFNKRNTIFRNIRTTDTNISNQTNKQKSSDEETNNKTISDTVDDNQTNKSNIRPTVKLSDISKTFEKIKRNILLDKPENKSLADKEISADNSTIKSEKKKPLTGIEKTREKLRKLREQNENK